MLLAQITYPRLHKETGGIAFLALLDYIKSIVYSSSVRPAGRPSKFVFFFFFGFTEPYTRTRSPISHFFPPFSLIWDTVEAKTFKTVLFLQVDFPNLLINGLHKSTIFGYFKFPLFKDFFFGNITFTILTI